MPHLRIPQLQVVLDSGRQRGDDVRLRFAFRTHGATLRGGSGLLERKQEVTGNTEERLEDLSLFTD